MAALKQALIAQGCRMVTANNGEKALEAFQLEQPELILLDLVMPQQGGLEVCRHIRESSLTPIIVLSIKGSEADIVSVLDLGADDYLVKPFRLAELLARIRAVLRRGNKDMMPEKIICGDLMIDTEEHHVRHEFSKSYPLSIWFLTRSLQRWNILYTNIIQRVVCPREP